jgi:phasin family protein
MNVTTEQFATANKATVETLLTVANTAFASAERLAALNLNTARAMLEDSVANAKALLGVKDVQQLMAMQTTLAQPAVEKAVAYSRSVYEIATQTQEELSKVVEGQFSEINKNVSTALDKAVKNAPAGSDVAVAAVKSAIAAANSAYDSMTKAAKSPKSLKPTSLPPPPLPSRLSATTPPRRRPARPPKKHCNVSSSGPAKGLVSDPTPQGVGSFLFQKPVEPQRHRARRGKHYTPEGTITRQARVGTIFGFSLCLCVSVVRNFGKSRRRRYGVYSARRRSPAAASVASFLAKQKRITR